METQPNEAVASGTDPIGAGGEDNLESILADHFADEEQEEIVEQPADPEASEEDTPEAQAEDEPEIEAELPPIDAPVSWTAEEKAEFSKLPREVQETLTRREQQREKFVQTKAQEAAQAREAARQEAMQYAAQLKAQAAEQLGRYAQQLTVQEPDPSLIVSDPQLYAQQMQAFRHYSAQSQQAQREAEMARTEAEQYQAAIEQQEQSQEIALLRDNFPEYLDPATGPKLQEQLSATATALGYPPELISQARASDILAMKTAADWKAKAEKWDRAMAKQMERVRAGKDKLPPVAKPGAPQPGTPQSRARINAEQALKGGTDRDLQAYLANLI